MGVWRLHRLSCRNGISGRAHLGDAFPRVERANQVAEMPLGIARHAKDQVARGTRKERGVAALFGDHQQNQNGWLHKETSRRIAIILPPGYFAAGGDACFFFVRPLLRSLLRM